MISSLTRKYALALLKAASSENQEDAYAQELQDFRALTEEHEELRETLENPVLAFPSKRRIIEALAEKIPLSKSVRNFILVVVSNARMHQFADFVEAYSEVLDQKRGIQRGLVVTARPLETGQQDRVKEGLEKLTGDQVRLDFQQDEDLIGGIKIRMGSTIFDGSIRARLDELERRLAGR